MKHGPKGKPGWLELELLEEEEYGHQSSAVDRQALARPAAAAPSEPAAQLREPLLPGDRSSRTRDWVEQSSQYGQLCLHYDADISAATNVTAVISKLPAALALKWGEHAVHSGLVRPTLADLDSWLRRYVAAGRASLTLTGHQQSKAEVNTWARRFAHNTRSRAAADRPTGPLTAEELREAERVWLLSTQAEQFGDEIEALQHGRRLPSNSQLHRLNPFLDSNGLLRVGGQLRHAQLDFKVKRRVILPARGDITRLIVTDRHEKLAHSGAEHVLAHLRNQFWVISGRAAVERYTPTCTPCRKRLSRLRGVDRSQPTHQAVTINDVTVIITEFRAKAKSAAAVASGASTGDTSSLSESDRHSEASNGLPELQVKA
ncbi:hypothetical protein FJT64_019538 [Amphibalanus amphitrite]|uniref:Integrase zinc-binding domain-containing protein n=1 Tax=Amphibalanus amphitrite TaxID=1232801 RepID=A0A6A4WRC9_AMPAM|nr:hypothetical protein FJT64_019538 [Amphibalanus amphitrite]